MNREERCEDWTQQALRPLGFHIFRESWGFAGFRRARKPSFSSLLSPSLLLPLSLHNTQHTTHEKHTRAYAHCQSRLYLTPTQVI